MGSHVRLMAFEGSTTLAARSTDSLELLDERAFQDLYGRTAAPLYAYVARTLGRTTDADDIVQEAYLRLLRTPVPRHDSQARAYLFRIASRLVIDRWRTDTRETRDVPERVTAAVDPAVRLDVRQALARLTPRERQLIWLAHVEGAVHREIAAALDLRVGSVRVLLWRTRRKLSRWLRRTGDLKQDVR